MLFGVTRIDPEGRARRSNGGDERVNSRAPMAPLIEVNTLRKRSGDIEALAGVSIHVAAGEIYSLLGPNGAGKSTTINILCGLIRPDGGEARLNGIDVVQRPVDARRVLASSPRSGDFSIAQLASDRFCLTRLARLPC
jgi:ABC-type branched-subunit amino acid transport system ATPase component